VYRRALLAAAGLGLTACSTVGKLTESIVSLGGSLVGLDKPHPKPQLWKSVTVVASSDANQDSPVAVDLVFVRDPALLEVLNTTPAAKWFATRTDLQRAFPEGVGVVSLEVVPGQTLRLTDSARIHQLALVVLAYASYPPPGEHRLRLQPVPGNYLLQLGPKGFLGAEAPAPAAK
jgi:type VI secretion system protein